MRKNKKKREYKLLHKALKVFHVIDLASIITEDMPVSEDVKENTLVILGGKDWAKWVLLKCPCGCGDLITLSLMKSHKAFWNLKIDLMKRVTLSPSIWKNDGCKSHFFVKKGKLRWAKEY